jgi:hypothetical protein
MLKQLNQGWLGVFYDYGADQDFPINLSILEYRTLVDVGPMMILGIKQSIWAEERRWVVILIYIAFPDLVAGPPRRIK